jgi:ATP-binding cassette subfamily B protein
MRVRQLSRSPRTKVVLLRIQAEDVNIGVARDVLKPGTPAETGSMSIREKVSAVLNAGALLAHVRRGMALVWECTPGYTLAATALVIVQGALPLLWLYFLKLVVDQIAASAGTTDPAVAFGHFALLVSALGGVGLVTQLCSNIASFVREAQGRIVTDRVHDLLEAKATQVDLAHYENPEYHDALHRAVREAPLRPMLIMTALLQVARAGLSLAAMAVLLVTFHWAVGVFLLVLAVPGFVVQVRHSRKVHAWRHSRTPVERLAQYYDVLLTRDTHAKELRLFDLGALFRARSHEVRRELSQEKTELLKRRTLAMCVAETVATVALFSLFAVIGRSAISGTISVGAFVMYFYAVQRGWGYLLEMLRGLSDLHEHSLFLIDLHDFLEIKARITAPRVPKRLPARLVKGIVFEHVDFTYPGGTTKVLDDFCLTLRAGEHIALVGENGAGKTTLVKLLCRFYDPTAGRITIDGIDLRELDPADLRRAISVTFQDFARYQLTARENILFGRLHDSPSMPDIEDAARLAGADEVIERLPKGYETVLGRWFEEGEELSIGEWQKVALARAFLRDAPIIALDEPTSAMDPRTEYEVFRAFHELTRDRTVILISHRLSTVRMADCVYFLSEGAITEKGTHEALVSQGGSYADLFETQARAYR